MKSQESIPKGMTTHSENYQRKKQWSAHEKGDGDIIIRTRSVK